MPRYINRYTGKQIQFSSVPSAGWNMDMSGRTYYLTETSNGFFDTISGQLLSTIPAIAVVTFTVDSGASLDPVLVGGTNIVWTWPDGVTQSTGTTPSPALTAIGKYTITMDDYADVTEFLAADDTVLALTNIGLMTALTSLDLSNNAQLAVNGVVDDIYAARATLSAMTVDVSGTCPDVSVASVQKIITLMKDFGHTWEFNTNWTILEINTANPGTSADDQFKMPLYPSETYNAIVFWDDGEHTILTTDVSPTHTFADGEGVYEIRVAGTFPRLYFAGVDDMQKLQDVKQWGDIVWSSFYRIFKGCSNLSITAPDAPDLSGVENMFEAFAACLTFNNDISAWDVSNVSIFEETFQNANAFNQPLDNWDMSAATNTKEMFENANAFNQPLGSWDVSLVTSANEMFQDANAFNQPLGSWDVSKITNMGEMFENTSMDQDLSNWQIPLLTGLNEMFKGTHMSTANYDALLISWAAQDVQNEVSFHGGNATYSLGPASVARASLVADHSWTIIDGGPDAVTFTTSSGVALDPVLVGGSNVIWTWPDGITISTGLVPDPPLTAIGKYVITMDDYAAVTHAYFDGDNLTAFENVVLFSGVTVLNLSDNSLTAIEGIELLTALDGIFLHNNPALLVDVIVADIDSNKDNFSTPFINMSGTCPVVSTDSETKILVMLAAPYNFGSWLRNSP